VKRTQIVFLLVVFGLVALGFVRERERGDDPSRAFRFSAPSEPSFDELTLPVGDLRLTGRVRGHTGTPAAGVEVFLFPRDARPGTAGPLHWCFTDRAGLFELEGLSPIPYSVVLYRPGLRPVQLEVELPRDSVTWTLPEPLPPLEVLPEIVRADLAGRVQPSANRTTAQGTLAGYEVCLRPAEGTHPLSGAVIRRARTGSDGSFRFEELVLERYRVELLPPWAASGSWPVLDRVELRPLEETWPRTVLRIRSGTVVGRLIDVEGRPIAGSVVRAWPEDDPDRTFPPVETDVDGVFELVDLPGGSYVVRVRAGTAAAETVASVREGETTSVELEPLDPRRPRRAPGD
jgi:hypothetical protein